MADKKISQLPAVTMPLAETEVLPIVQSSTTKKVTVAELTTLIKHTMTMDSTNALQFGDAGYTASIAYNGDGSLRIKPRSGYPLQVDLANIKFSNAGYGIDFSANGGDVLTQYDEGSWTVKLFDAAGGGNQSATTVTGYYTRVGNLVHCAFWGLNNISTAGMTAGNVLHIELPFTASATGSGTGSFASENITFNGRDNATPAVPVGYNRAIIRAYGSATSSASVLVSNVGASANIDYFSMTYRV